MNNDTQDAEPTILSFEDSINLMKKKYGDDWFKNPFAKMILVWNSSLFLTDHVKEVCEKYPGLHDLCEEYYNFGTVEGNPLPIDFHSKIMEFMLGFDLPKKMEIFGTSPVRNSYWKIE